MSDSSSSSSSSSGDDSSASSSSEESHTLQQQQKWILQAATSSQSVQGDEEDEEKDEDSSQSDESFESSNRRPKRNNNTKKTSTLSESSSEDDDDSDYSATRKESSARRSTKKPAVTKARQYNAKNKPQPAVTTRRQHKAQIRGRSSGSDSQSVSFSSGSEEESVRPTRSSRRAQTAKTISYKENDSNQETDSDDYVETTAADAAAYEEDSNVPKIEKIMDGRFGRQGATGVETTAFNVRLHGDKNENFNPNEESEERHYLIKWNGKSHLHNTWESEDTLYEMNCSGLKRLENFKRKRMNINTWMRQASLEDQEYYMCQQEMNRNVLENYRTVERVFARSAEKNEFGRYDYRVKWVGLPYIESTWEDSSLIKEDFQSHIDEFSMRQENPCVPKRECRAIRHRPNFVEMTRQPDWLGGKLKLRDYQLEGVNWLSRSWCKGNSVILADEMGLGKTIQTITFLSYLYHTHELYGLFLVIVPLSTMTSWQNEFQTWAPFMNVIVYMGDQSSRALIRDVEWKFPNGHFKFNAVLTSYEILLKDKTFLGSHSWAVIAVDEAHRLKNEDSLLYKSLKEFKSNHRILITGTPMQNSLKELWALLHFIMPLKFESWSQFEYEHAENREVGYASLHKALHPYLLRRVKKDVEKSLPLKVEKILRVQMAKKQKQFYKWILTRNYAALRKGGRGRGGFSSFCNIVMELKKCCNHAHLINEPTFPDDVDQDTVFQDLLKSSGKMVLLDKLLIRFKQDGHRVLIFSQMVQMLDIIQTYLRKRRFQFQRLDGSVDSAARKRALDHFNAEGSEDFCFLLSTRAGGLGINLATADTVIIFDSDWNPMNDLQAQARAHRIGQKKQVHIFRLVCAGSVEENIVERAKQKMVLDHLVIQRMDTSGKTVLFKQSANSSNSNNPFNKEELNAILQFGAEDLFAETENDEKEPECDIDDILQRAELRQEQSGSSAYEELLSGFKVATFKMDEEESQIKDWDNIIPQKDRQAIEEEEKLKKEKEMFLPPRQRKSLKFNDGSDDEDDSDSLPTNEDEEDTTSKRHRNTGGRKGNRDWDDEHVQGFTTAEVRKFVRSFRKFGDPLNRLDAIARDAELNEQSEADLKRLGKALYDRLQSMSNHIKTSQDHQEESSKRGRGPSFRLAGVSVSVKTTLACIENLKPLSDAIPKSAEERRNFRLNLPVRPISTWDCSWNIEDDSKLLVGIYEHGMGNWEQIQSDPNLSLGQKILRPNNEKPQIRQLTSRSDHLIKALVKSQRKTESKSKRSTTAATNNTTASTTTSSTSSSRRSNRNNEAKQDKTPELTKTRTRGRKAKSKAIVEDVSEQEDQAENHTPSSSTSRKSRKSKRKRHHNATTVTPSGENSVKEEDSAEVQENQGRSAKRRKKNKVENSKSSSHSSSLPMTINSDSVLIGLDVDSVELAEKEFESCKEQLRPVKLSLKQLVQKYAQPEKEENLEQVRREHMTKCLLQIGDRIIECLRCLHKPEDMKKTRTNLWNFVSNFTEYNANKWLKLYKSAVENRDFKLEGHKEDSNAVKMDAGSPHKHKKSHKDKRSNASADTQSSRSSHHRHGKESRKRHQNEEQSSKNEKSSHSGKPKHSMSPSKSSQDMRLHPHPSEDSWSSRGGGSRSSASNHQRPDCPPPGAPPADYWPPSGNPDYRRAPRSPERSGGRFPPRGGDEYGGSGDFRSSGGPPPPPPYGRREYRRSPPPRDYYLPPSSGGGDRRGGPPMYNYSPPRGYGGGYHGGGPPPHPNYHQRRWRPPPERSYPPPSRNPPSGSSGYGGSGAPYSEEATNNNEPDGPSSMRRAEKT